MARGGVPDDMWLGERRRRRREKVGWPDPLVGGGRFRVSDRPGCVSGENVTWDHVTNANRGWAAKLGRVMIWVVVTAFKKRCDLYMLIIQMSLG